MLLIDAFARISDPYLQKIPVMQTPVTNNKSKIPTFKVKSALHALNVYPLFFRRYNLYTLHWQRLLMFCHWLQNKKKKTHFLP